MVMRIFKGPIQSSKIDSTEDLVVPAIEDLDSMTLEQITELREKIRNKVEKAQEEEKVSQEMTEFMFISLVTPVPGALHRSWPFCQYKFKLNNGYHVKKHEKLHRIPKIESTLSRQNLRGSKVEFLQCRK